MHHGRSSVVAVLAVVAVCGVAACGGSGTVVSAAYPAPPGTEVPVPGSDIGPAPAGAAPGLAPVAPLAPGTVAPTSFCRDVEEFQGVLPLLLQPNGTTAALDRLRALFARLQADAPSGIQPAVGVLAQMESRLAADLNATPPNLADAARVLTARAHQQSLQQVLSYAATHC